MIDWTCRSCGKVFTRKDNLVRHQRSCSRPCTEEPPSKKVKQRLPLVTVQSPTYSSNLDEVVNKSWKNRKNKEAEAFALGEEEMVTKGNEEMSENEEEEEEMTEEEEEEMTGEEEEEEMTEEEEEEEMTEEEEEEEGEMTGEEEEEVGNREWTEEQFDPNKLVDRLRNLLQLTTSTDQSHMGDIYSILRELEDNGVIKR